MAPDPPAGITVEELWRRMDGFKSSMDNGFARLDHRFETLGHVSRERYDADMRSVTADIAELKGSAKWQARAAAGMVVTVVGAMIITLIETRGGV